MYTVEEHGLVSAIAYFISVISAYEQSVDLRTGGTL